MLAALGLAAPLTAHAVPFTASLTAAADGDIKTFGGVSIDTTDFIVSVQSSGANETWGILEYDLSSIPDTATITSARLRLETFGLLTNVCDAPVTVDFYAFDGDGTVGLGDESAGGTLVASEIYPSGTVGAGGTPANSLLDIDFLTLTEVEDAVTGATSDFLAIRLDTINFATFRVYSTENAGGFLAPTLEINYEADVVDAQSPLLLFAGGLLAIRLLRKRRV